MNCLILACVLLAIGSVECKKTKEKAIKKVNEIREALQNSSATGTEQWRADFNHEWALKDDSDIPFGVLSEDENPEAPERKEKEKERSGKTRTLGRNRQPAAASPPTRVPPLKPGETALPTGQIKLPDEYDSSQIWGQRCPSFTSIMNQGYCGNCWAVAITAMINDRTCQYNTEGEPEFYHSGKHLTLCQAKGCNGGWFTNGLDYWIQQGLPSGGDYGTEPSGGCKKFPDNDGTQLLINGTCETMCDDGVTPVASSPRSYGGARYQVTPSEVDIMGEIFMYGPVVSTFDVYDDFAHYYTGGVYKRVSNTFLGGHATKLYGWGVENGVKFWYAANSWGTTWGDKGFFKIQRGTNECNIETNLYAAVPRAGIKEAPAAEEEPARHG